MCKNVIELYRHTRYQWEIMNSSWQITCALCLFNSVLLPWLKINTILARSQQKLKILQDSGRKYISCKNLTEKIFLARILQDSCKKYIKSRANFSVEKHTENDQHGHRRVSCPFLLPERDKHRSNHR